VDHRQELERLGITKVDGLLSQTEATTAREQIIQIARAHDLYSSAGWAVSEDRFSNTKTFRVALTAISHSEAFPNFVSERLINIASSLQGAAVTPLPPGQQILFTLPGAPSWSVPHDVWHVDIPRLGELGAPGLQMFTFLDDVEPKGGGTLVLAGSHKLMNDAGVLRSKALKQQLAKAPYFRSLFSKQRAPITLVDQTAGSSDGVDLRVVELTGQPGDVYFMDLRALHTPASNTSNTARLMLTCRLPRSIVAPVCMTPETGS